MLDVIDAIRLRKSIRKFKPEPVPKEVLQDIIATAIRTPSGVNSQPWEITVVSGLALENLKQTNIEMLLHGVPAMPEVPEVGFTGIYLRRQRELGMELFRLMGIPRRDRVKRAEWAMRGFRYFDAPAAIILSMDRSIGEELALFDIGAISQTICLAALNYGLGTCIERQGVNFPEAVRKHTGIPESKRQVISIAIGYPDWDFPANKVESKREPLENVVTWCGFD